MGTLLVLLYIANYAARLCSSLQYLTQSGNAYPGLQITES